MIINSSRASTALTCWREAFHSYVENVSHGGAGPLVVGSAVHAGLASFLSGHSEQEAGQAAAEAFHKEKEKLLFPEEEDFPKLMLQVEACLYSAIRSRDPAITIIQPECEFLVPIGEKKHNCILLHWYDNETQQEVWGPPPPEKILAGAVASPHNGVLAPQYKYRHECPCYVPHQLRGRTDLIVKWMGQLWLEDHKTTAVKGRQFFDGFIIDIQPTAYIYGIWKALGIRPMGLIINAIWKPTDKMVAEWNSKRKHGPDKDVHDYIACETEKFPRTEEDLARFESQMISLCDEWESRIISGDWRMSNVRTTCIRYNRLCQYHYRCATFTFSEPREAGTRAPDYVDEALQKQLVQITGSGPQVISLQTGDQAQ